MKRWPDTATADEIRLFQLHLTETGPSICNRNRIMTGLRFLFRVTLRRLDLAAEIYHIKEPQKIPLVMSQDEAKRLLAMATRPTADGRADETRAALVEPISIDVWPMKVATNAPANWGGRAALWRCK